ncbi:MAG: hypothetical protein Q9216_006987 [Gyalolechia sp. 2 TL-2023]
MAPLTSSSLSIPPPEEPAKSVTTTTTATRYSKRKRGEAPSPPPETDVAPPVAKKRRPQPINTSGKKLPAGKRLPKKAAATNVPSNIQERVVPVGPIYPSPWAEVGGEHWNVNKTAASKNVKLAYGVQKLIGRPVFDWAREVGLVTWYRNIKADIATYVDQELMYMKPVVGVTWIAGYGQVCWRDQIATSKRAKSGKANMLRARSTMEIFREGEGNKAEFFLTWQDTEDVNINGTSCMAEIGKTTACVAGPLPSFAIIEVEETVIFWFRDAEAMDYITPEIQQEKLNDELLGDALHESEKENGEDEGDEEEEDEDEEDEEEEEEQNKVLNREWVYSRSSEWGRIWRAGIGRHLTALRGDTEEAKPYNIPFTSDLSGEDVVVGIAALWRTVEKDLGQRFAFHESVYFDVVRGPMTDGNGHRLWIPAAVHGPHDFLIPLTFSIKHLSPPNSAEFPQSPDATNVGAQSGKGDAQSGKAPSRSLGTHDHILFAVAQKRPNHEVDVNIFDSCPGIIPVERTLGAISKTVRKIGWLGMDKSGGPIELEYCPTFVVEERQPVVPKQEGIDTCGLYSILNAWMFMLGLPMVDRNKRVHYPGRKARQTDADEFLDGALDTINCAIAGHMDLETIQAFFNWYGYCELQDPKDGGARLSSAYLTTRMSPEILTDVLDEERAIEQVTTEYEERTTSYPVEDTNRVRDNTTGCSHSEIVQLLLLTEGDAESAIALQTAMTSE